ncbi:tyrosyl-tRNA synthetase [Clostridium acidisoli DSM 12555]|uniref:Tyrosine--tRNA ligase n=1 Tax=Clostridium acidisoli DSM 12555 TaxID=1121291 RepID=A0A1W1XV55_9CLOT|nr:tyrosine--tRNA ligase [Clostridium acidisoli]SMC27767.1 tyrosyl-tRNA synthetase [Clostridium acidisoli DSM 12555]
MKSVEEQLKIIMKGVDDIIGLDELKLKLKQNRQLTVKLGLDPSAPDIHLGHTVVLRKIKQLQDLGHNAVLIIGDFTGMIGDPTGKSKTRKALTKSEVLKNAKTYEEQIFKILNKNKTQIRFNSEWLAKLTMEDALDLASSITVARMLERDDFKNRYESNTPISIHEFFYPLLQGYDSVAIKADIELGGTDQRFNVLMGRTLQKQKHLEPQATIFMPLLEGIDGIKKMSKSLGNYIGIDESPIIMYEKAMKIPDSLIVKYYNLITDVHPDEIKFIKKTLSEKNTNPRDIKMSLAREIVKLYHDEGEAINAEEHFKNVYQQNQIPNDVLTIEVSKDSFDIAAVLVNNNIVSSKSEVRRLAMQGGLKINDVKLFDINKLPNTSTLNIQIGKRKFIRIILS